MASDQVLQVKLPPEALAQIGKETIELAGWLKFAETGEYIATPYSPEMGEYIGFSLEQIPGGNAAEKAQTIVGLAQSQNPGARFSQGLEGYISNLIDQAAENVDKLNVLHAQGVVVSPDEHVQGVDIYNNDQLVGSYSIEDIDAYRKSLADENVQISKPSGSSSTVAEPAQATQVVTRMEPVEQISDDVRERVMRIEDALSRMAPAINAAFDDANIPAIGAVDGVFDKDSFAAFDRTMQYMSGQVGVDYTNGCTDDFCDTLESRLSMALSAKMFTASGEEKEGLQYAQDALPQLIDDIKYLTAADALRAVEMKEVQVVVPSSGSTAVNVEAASGSAPASNVPASAPSEGSVDGLSLNANAQGSSSQVDASSSSQGGGVAGAGSVGNNAGADELPLDGAIYIVEEAMSRVLQNVDKIPLGGFADKIDSIKDQFVKPINIDDGRFDENSQDMSSTLLMVLKKLNGEENPDGTYNERIGDTLELAILTKDEFAFIREEMGINGKYSVEDAKILAQGEFVPAKFYPSGAETEEEAAARKAEHDSQQREARITYETRLNQLRDGNDEGLKNLSSLFKGLDVLHEKNVLDPQKKAAEKTQNNLMFDIAGGFLAKTGMMPHIKDFFTNNAIGQFLATILNFIGFDVKRLWGEESPDLRDDPQAQAQQLGNDFENVYNEIKAKNPNADHAALMRMTKEETLDGMDGFIARSTLKMVLGSDNQETLRAAVESAMDKAAQADSLEASKQAFVEGIKAYQVVEQDLAPALNDIGQQAEAIRQDREYIALLNAQEVEAFDGSEVQLNDTQALDTVIEYDTDAKDQDPLRYGNVLAIQTYMHENAQALGLNEENVAAFAQIQDDGSVVYTEVLDIETCAAIEEMWVKAKLYHEIEAAKADNQDITADMVDSWIAKIDPEKLAKGPGIDGRVHEDMAVDLALMRAYADSRGALEGFEAIENNQIIEAEEALVTMDTDMGSSADGQIKKYSVLEQSLTWNQVDITKLAIEMKEAAQVVTAAPKPDPNPQVQPAQEAPEGACEANDCEGALTGQKSDHKSPAKLPSIADGRGDQDPKNYRELPVFPLNTEEAKFLSGYLVKKDPELVERAGGDSPEEILRAFAMEKQQQGGNQYLLMDLDVMGVDSSHPNFDGVMVHFEKGQNSVPEFRYYDHDIHEITSIAEHRMNAHNRYERSNPLSPGNADFDTFFSIKERNGTVVSSAPSSTTGFLGMSAVSENLDLVNGYAAVYGGAAYNQEKQDNEYSKSYLERAHYYKTDENARYVQSMQNRVAASQGVTQPTQTNNGGSGSPRLQQFNHNSGASCDHLKPEFEQMGEKSWIGLDSIMAPFRVWGIKSQQQEWNDCKNGVGDYAPENRVSSIQVDQAIQDIGADQFDPEDEQGFVPGMKTSNASTGVSRTA